MTKVFVDPCEGILRDFPGPVMLYPSRKKWLLILLFSGVFAAGGFWMIASAAPKGWFVLIVFGLGTIVGAAMQLPGAASLTLDRDGFQGTVLFRSRRARWQDVTEFEPVTIGMNGTVGYDHIGRAGHPLTRLNVAISGHNSGLGDTYGLTAAELARVMTQWRELALGLPPLSEDIRIPPPPTAIRR